MNTTENNTEEQTEFNQIVRGYRFDVEAMKKASSDIPEKRNYPFFFKSKNDYEGNYTIAIVFEDGRFTLMRQLKLIKDCSLQVISMKDPFYANVIIEKKYFRRDNIHVDFDEIPEKEFFQLKNDFAYQLFEVNLSREAK